MTEMPDCPSVDHCHCFPAQEMEAGKRGSTLCVCSPSEKALRGWVNGRIKIPMTPVQRAWCANEIFQVEYHDQQDFDAGTDEGLALGVLTAWQALDIKPEVEEV